MIILQFVLAQSAEYAQHSGSRVAQLGLLANHKSVGMTILALAVLRLGWRLAVRPPRLPAHMPGWQVTVSHLTHWLLYGFLFALPLTGWLMSSAASYSVSWFGLFTWPDLVAPDTGLRDSMKFIHDLLGKGLFVITVLHILAACKHHFLDRDDVLRRMTSAMPLLVGGVILAGGTYALTDVGAPTSAAQSATDAPTPAPAGTTGEDGSSAIATPADTGEDTSSAIATPAGTGEDMSSADAVPAETGVAIWQIDHDASSIRFTAEQAGADFTGTWTDWSAVMQFDRNALTDSRFDVRIAVAGVDTSDADRDSTLQDPEFFDAESFPTVRFLASEFEATDAGFTSPATLVVKGSEHPVQFDFTVSIDGDQRQLDGTARLDRLALGVGTGDWADTEWVGQYVDVTVRVLASVAAGN